MIQAFKNMGWVSDAWAAYRNKQLHNEYELRREYYENAATQLGIIYREEEVVKEIRNKIAARGYSVKQKTAGDVHTFAIVPHFSWHKHLIPDLLELGPVSLYDYVSEGYSPELFYTGKNWTRHQVAARTKMLSEAFTRVQKVHSEKPLDWIFCYGGGQDLSADFIKKLTEKIGVPVVNITFDDKQGWVGNFCGDHRTGARDITKELDVFFTSARVACPWHAVEGGRSVYMPEGFDSSYFKPLQIKQDIDISFLGASYGFRGSTIGYLKSFNLDVTTFGQGWKNGFAPDPVRVFNASRINLGMGGIGYSESLTNVKGRDFEIPGTGGGMYITSFNPDLAQHFVLGEEIVCYRNRDEMVELIRYYLNHPEEAAGIARKARERSLNNHRWLHRYQAMLEILGILKNTGK